MVARRSARMASKQHKKTIASEVLALPELLDRVIEEALQYSRRRDCIALRSVNRLWRDATDAKAVRDLVLWNTGIAPWGIGPCDRDKNLDAQQILDRNPYLARFIYYANWQGAGPLPTFQIEILSLAINLRKIELTDEALDMLGDRYSQEPFELRKLSSMSIEWLAPYTSGEEHTNNWAFLQSLKSLKHLYLDIDVDVDDLAKMFLPSLLDGTAHQIETLVIKCYDVTKVSRAALASVLCQFTRLYKVYLTMGSDVMIRDLPDLLPSTLQKLYLRCGRTVMMGLLEGLGDPKKLRHLAEVPELQEFCETHSGDDREMHTMPLRLVERAIAGIFHRPALQDPSKCNRWLTTMVGEEGDGDTDIDDEELMMELYGSEGESRL